MFNNSQLSKNVGFCLDQIQNEVYFLLKSYMEDNNLNQKELAEKLGFSAGYVSQILNGNFNYSLKKLIELSMAINKVPVISFVDVKSKMEELNKLNCVKTIVLPLYSNTQIGNNSLFVSEDYKYA